MSEVQRLRHQLRAAYDGPPWHGPSLSDLLADVTAESAAHHGIPGAHSIWELVLHMTYWRRVVLGALAGRSIADHQPNTPEDWRLPTSITGEVWDLTREALRESQDQLLSAMKGLDDPQLLDHVPGRDYPIFIMLHGIVQHDVYHAGQIALLKKLAPEVSS